MTARLEVRRRRVAAIGAILALAGAPALGAQVPAETLSVEERMFVASRLYAALPQFFAHWEALPPGFDLDSVYRRYLARALADSDRRAFDLASMEFMASLQNGHTYFRDTRLANRERAFPFDVRHRDGRWVVVTSRSDAVRPGDVITAVDGESVDAVFGRLRRYLAASDPRWARLRLFRTPMLFPGRVTLTLADGRRVTIDRSATRPAAPAPDLESRVLEGGIGYLRIRSFVNRATEDSAVAFVQAHGALPAIIVDVRNNGGGSTPSRLITALMNRSWRWFIEATPAWPALHRARQEFNQAELRWNNGVTPPDSGAYRGRVVLLADEACWSACDGFVVPFRDNGRATIVGDTTGGSSGQPVFVNLPNGMSYQVSTKRQYQPDGSPFEGAGIAPHIVVRPTPEDLRAGRDPVLERGLKAARGG